MSKAWPNFLSLCHETGSKRESQFFEDTIRIKRTEKMESKFSFGAFVRVIRKCFQATFLVERFVFLHF